VSTAVSSGSDLLREAHRLTEKRWVTQCALSRICGCCAMSLGRPVVFLGTAQEVARNEFHLPPMHAECAAELLRSPRGDDAWESVETAGFEFVRPLREETDQRMRFEPNSLL
jgi:hypothetical protein